MKDLSSARSGAETAAGRPLQAAKGSFPSRHISNRWLKAPKESCVCLHGDENGEEGKLQAPGSQPVAACSTPGTVPARGRGHVGDMCVCICIYRGVIVAVFAQHPYVLRLIIPAAINEEEEAASAACVIKLPVMCSRA